MNPIYVDFLITSFCNFKCAFCSASAPNNNHKKDLTFNEIENILRELNSLEVLRVAFEGGEPFLRKDFFKILKVADSCDFEYYINTNGSLITSSVAKKLKKTKVSKICVSIDGPNEKIHDKIRGYNGAFSNAVNAIKFLLEEKIQVNAIITLTKENYLYLYETLIYLKTIGIDKVALMLLATVGENNINQSIPFKEWSVLLQKLSNDKLNNRLPVDLRIVATSESMCQWEIFLPLKDNLELYYLWVDKNKSVAIKNEFSCTAAKRNLAIDGCGNVYGCSLMVSNNELSAGNIKTNSIKDIWESSAVFNNLRNLEIKNIHGPCKKCLFLYECKGGCRACAFNFHKNILDSDYRCPLTNVKEMW